jgi:hypothetical protein
MKKRLVILLCFMLAACQPQIDAPRLVITPFPTTTPGYVVEGEVPREGIIPLQDSGLSSPATAVAIARQPTATPNLTVCPILDRDITMEDTPPQTPSIVVEEIVRYLTVGGETTRLEETLSDKWKVVGEGSLFRADIDLTGEGTPEIIMTYVPPNGNGTLLIIGCIDGIYSALYQVEAETAQPPQVITPVDMNNNRVNDLFFVVQQCSEDAEGNIISDSCEYRLRLITWQPHEGRFADLIQDEVTTTTLPTVNDIDNDRVTEIIVKQESRGTRATGPLRTGTFIYDWNGLVYVLSIAQPDPPRFRIQVLHEADRQFNQREVQIALPMYREALSDSNDLRYWFDDEPNILRSYGLYRLLLAQIVAADLGQFDTHQTLTTLYPDLTIAPVYAEMGAALFENFQTSHDVSTACDTVQAIIALRGEAVELLNRYGSRSPTYTATDLCPF